MNRPEISIKVRSKFGREFYDAEDSTAKDLLTLMRKKTFTLENIQYLNNMGWLISYVGESQYFKLLGLKKK